jgi:hypothetical protein
MWTIIDTDNPSATPIPELDEALQLSPAPAPRRSVLATVGYLLASLALIGMLAAQYLIYHYQTLSNNPDVRPWLSRICEPGLCTLPPLSDISQIRSEALFLRSHPDLPGMLVLQMNFRNLANFNQPLPAFDLMFTDVRSTAIASRRFQPHDYLGTPKEELTEESLTMPGGALVMANLVFADPGSDAVNYQITFTSALTENNQRTNRFF